MFPADENILSCFQKKYNIFPEKLLNQRLIFSAISVSVRSADEGSFRESSHKYRPISRLSVDLSEIYRFYEEKRSATCPCASFPGSFFRNRNGGAEKFRFAETFIKISVPLSSGIKRKLLSFLHFAHVIDGKFL